MAPLFLSASLRNDPLTSSNEATSRSFIQFRSQWRPVHALTALRNFRCLPESAQDMPPRLATPRNTWLHATAGRPCPSCLPAGCARPYPRGRQQLHGAGAVRVGVSPTTCAPPPHWHASTVVCRRGGPSSWLLTVRGAPALATWRRGGGWLWLWRGRRWAAVAAVARGRGARCLDNREGCEQRVCDASRALGGGLHLLAPTA